MTELGEPMRWRWQCAVCKTSMFHAEDGGKVICAHCGEICAQFGWHYTTTEVVEMKEFAGQRSGANVKPPETLT